VVEGALK
jgi:AraC family transcriptional regulator